MHVNYHLRCVISLWSKYYSYMEPSHWWIGKMIVGENWFSITLWRRDLCMTQSMWNLCAASKMWTVDFHRFYLCVYNHFIYWGCWMWNTYSNFPDDGTQYAHISLKWIRYRNSLPFVGSGAFFWKPKISYRSRQSFMWMYVCLPYATYDVCV